MANDSFQRQSSMDTRQLMVHLIVAREQYSIYLRGVATGQRQPDPTEQEILKKKCDETVSAWHAGHEANRLTRRFSVGIDCYTEGANIQCIN